MEPMDHVRMAIAEIGRALAAVADMYPGMTHLHRVAESLAKHVEALTPEPWGEGNAEFALTTSPADGHEVDQAAAPPHMDPIVIRGIPA